MNHTLLYLFMSAIRESHHGRAIRDILWLDPILTIRFQNHETRCIVALLSNPGPFCYTSIDHPLAGCGARQVFEECYGGTLTGMSVSDTDSILRLDVTARREPLSLSLVLYGNAGAAVLTRDDTRIVSLGKGGERAGIESSRRNVLPALVHIGQAELGRYLESGPPAGVRAPGLEPELLAAFTSQHGRCEVDSLLQFRDGLLSGSRSFYLAARKRIHRAFPIAGPPVKSEAEASLMGPFTSGIAAGRYIGEQLLEETYALIVDRRIRPIRKQLSAKKKLRSHLLEELQRAQEFGRLRRETEALAAYQTRVPPGSTSTQVPNPYQEGEILTIKLDPSTPLKTQIKKRFQKAAKLERSVGKVASRLDNIERQIRHLDKIIESSTRARSFSEAINFIDGTLHDLGVSQPHSRASSTREKGKTYRRYDIDNDWFVLVGRSNSENDFITFHLASPNDWWFHAQSVPGSHVVLKSKGTGENPPDRVLAAAAGIAAYYSKSRHASLVPVIYTRRKYVRKPRKAPPGKVICEREKTLFAEPELPQSQKSSGEE
jgi:hypothetical protein